MSSRVWLGARRLVLKPDGIEFDYAGDRATGTLVFEGPYELCLSSRPSAGSTMPGFGGLTVDRSVVRRGGAPGMGELTVYLSDETSDDNPTTGQPRTEIYWLEVERDLRLNKRYLAGGPMELTNLDLAQLALWQAETDYAAKASGEFHPRNGLGEILEEVEPLSEAAFDFAQKVMRGNDSWTDYIPVATLATFSRAKPSAVRVCGKIINGKPFDACPDGYVFRRSGDTYSRTGRHGKWARTQTFVGAAAWDTDLYETETP